MAITSSSRLLTVLLAVLLVAAAACTAPAPTSTSPSASSSPVALDAAIEAYLTSGSGNLDNVTSLVIDVDGAVVTELTRAEARPDGYAHVYSVTKSVVSTLVGIAVGEGRLSLDQTLIDLLPRHRRWMSAEVQTITLRQLLTMTSGMRSSPDDSTELRWNSLQVVLRLPLSNPPGTQFEYSDIGADVVAAVLAEAVGMSVLDYARVQLFDPLGISTSPAYTGVETFAPSKRFAAAGFAWGTTEDGVHHGCCLLRLTTADMIKIGRLYLDQGRWEGRQVVPAEWVAQTTASAAGGQPDYGFLWWINPLASRPSFAAFGWGGQAIVVIPELRAVIAVTSWPNPAMFLDASLLGPLIDDVIVPRIS